ncbi:NUMOD4 domain-containing protein [Nocardia cyriacigeorgica]|uniref:NUMOD4 domain-containing protein n=1 Tax=Nocardia cyriacigeorgica TaxID=135487 RepID=UPI0013D22465|nr:hypothetical protein [Nocardia cyriacigeorgica]
MTQRWMPIPGYVGHYEVSDQGCIRSIKREPHKIMKARESSRSGYMRINLNKDGVKRTHDVHTLVASAFLGPKPEGCRGVIHLSGDYSDNRLVNLKYE